MARKERPKILRKIQTSKQSQKIEKSMRGEHKEDEESVDSSKDESQHSNDTKIEKESKNKTKEDNTSTLMW